MITVMDSRMNNAEKCLDSQLWHACAGSMVQIPSLNSKVFYFPQGHAEHANENVDFGNLVIPSLILCRISGIKFMADPETDEVYARITLVPLRESEFGYEDGFHGGVGVENGEKPSSFAKTLTQSDANNGGGFSVPRYCADTIFPRLDYNAEPPVQTIHVKDVQGDVWKFRHIYRGTPRRHLLTTGWSNFVNRKKLVAGDSIVFLRGENEDLCVGIRRAKRGIGIGHEYPSWWNNSNGDPRGRIRSEHVIEAATRAAKGETFEVVYYPRASTPEFCVKASSVRAAMQTNWYPGMRFKMAFETEDSSRISWFMGTIANAQVVDPIRWSNSPWRLLQVAWDEPDLLHNVKHVSPWLVELVTNIPTIHLDPFSPPRKKMRLPQQADLSLLDQIRMQPFPGGIQGARHAQYGLSSSDLHSNKLHSGLFPLGLHQLNHTAPPMGLSGDYGNDGNPTRSSKQSNETKAPHILLFGQIIFIEQQGSQSCSDTIANSSSNGTTDKTVVSSDGSGSALHQNARESSSDEGSPRWKELQKFDIGLETGQCKVFMESENVGRTLDLSVLRSYEELHSNLATMFDVESSDMLSSVLHRDAYGSIKHTGDEPFSEFTKTARRLTVLTDSGSDNIG